MSVHEAENSSTVSVTYEEVAWQFSAITDPLTQQLAPLCDIMRELKNEKANRRHKEPDS